MEALAYSDSLLNNNLLDKAINYFNNNASWLVAIWFILFSAKCVRLFTNLAYIQRIRNYKIHLPEELLDKQVAGVDCQTSNKKNHLLTGIGIGESSIGHWPPETGNIDSPWLCYPAFLLRRWKPYCFMNWHISGAKTSYQSHSEFWRNYLLL